MKEARKELSSLRNESDNPFSGIKLGPNFQRMRRVRIREILDEIREYESSMLKEGKEPSLIGFKVVLEKEYRNLT